MRPQYIRVVLQGDMKRVMGRRLADRRVFLFDFLLVGCKTRRAMPAVSAGHETKLKVKESISLRMVRGC